MQIPEDFHPIFSLLPNPPYNLKIEVKALLLVKFDLDDLDKYWFNCSVSFRIVLSRECK